MSSKNSLIMKNKTEQIIITKASGKKVPFNSGKLKKSLTRAGAGNLEADEIIEEVTELLVQGMSTSKIHKTAFRLLKNVSRPVAARYKLKQALLELGPSGFPFEQFVAELLKHEGFKTQVGVFVQGHCVTHEVDVIAEKESRRMMIECKFHNRAGYICDVKIPLYIQSRFADVATCRNITTGQPEKFDQGWVVTNTRFSEDAAKYGKCMNMHLVGWDFPKGNALKDWVDRSGLHPVTSLTTITQKEKQQLLNDRIVLCKTILNSGHILENIGIRPPRLQKVINECAALCEPR
jgi:hypothetical protein